MKSLMMSFFLNISARRENELKKFTEHFEQFFHGKSFSFFF